MIEANFHSVTNARPVHLVMYHVDVRVLSSHADNAHGELGLDSGEKALESAFISKGSSRSVTYPIANC